MKTWTTQRGVKVLVVQGKKSPYDFVVRYVEPGKRQRTPKHIHIVVDLFAKRAASPGLTSQFLDHVVNNIIRKVIPAPSFPPTLQVFDPAHAQRFRLLNTVGEYDIEFLLIVLELIMIQEKTNYPAGILNLKLFEALASGKDIFTVVSAATFRG